MNVPILYLHTYFCAHLQNANVGLGWPGLVLIFFHSYLSPKLSASKFNFCLTLLKLSFYSIKGQIFKFLAYPSTEISPWSGQDCIFLPSYTMRTNLPKTLDQLIFSKFYKKCLVNVLKFTKYLVNVHKIS